MRSEHCGHHLGKAPTENKLKRVCGEAWFQHLGEFTGASCRIPWGGHAWGGDPRAHPGWGPFRDCRADRELGCSLCTSSSSSWDYSSSICAVGCTPSAGPGSRHGEEHTAKVRHREEPWPAPQVHRAWVKQLMQWGWGPGLTSTCIGGDALQSGRGNLCVLWTAVHRGASTSLLRVTVLPPVSHLQCPEPLLWAPALSWVGTASRASWEGVQGKQCFWTLPIQSGFYFILPILLCCWILKHIEGFGWVKNFGWKPFSFWLEGSTSLCSGFLCCYWETRSLADSPSF